MPKRLWNLGTTSLTATSVVDVHVWVLHAAGA